MQPFVLTSNVASVTAKDTRVVEVPGELSDKNTLLSWYAKALELPDYFGANWDALDECIRDLSWINERRVVLYHRAVPLEASPKDQEIYLAVLANAVRDWKSREAHELIVAFDSACERKLRAAMRTQ
jgi:Barstar (barnase inhibitor)